MHVTDKCNYVTGYRKGKVVPVLKQLSTMP
jgi:hypothetical protein